MHIKTANGKKKVVMSKREWQAIGKKAGWEEPIEQTFYRNFVRPGLWELSRMFPDVEQNLLRPNRVNSPDVKRPDGTYPPGYRSHFLNMMGELGETFSPTDLIMFMSNYRGVDDARFTKNQILLFINFLKKKHVNDGHVAKYDKNQRKQFHREKIQTWQELSDKWAEMKNRFHDGEISSEELNRWYKENKTGLMYPSPNY